MHKAYRQIQKKLNEFEGFSKLTDREKILVTKYCYHKLWAIRISIIFVLVIIMQQLSTKLGNDWTTVLIIVAIGTLVIIGFFSVIEKPLLKLFYNRAFDWN